MRLELRIRSGVREPSLTVTRKVTGSAIDRDNVGADERAMRILVSYACSLDQSNGLRTVVRSKLALKVS